MPRQLSVSTAAVAAGHPHGAAAGDEILREGGNAVDAAVGAMLALSVAVPGSVGLGGYGGSAVIYLAGNEQGAGSRRASVTAVDFDSCAPIAFQDGLVTADSQSSYYGARAVTVPAVVAGLDLMLREFGTKSWSDVSRPAILLAENGFEFDSEHGRYLDRCAPHFDRQSLGSLFGAGELPKVGDCWQQPDLAQLLRRLADEGPAALYVGEIAQRIVKYLQDRGGILTDEDFRTYKPQIVEAVHTTFRGFDIHTPPPPSGGLTSLAIVQTVGQLLERRSSEPWGAKYFHTLAEVMKLCWQERHQHLGDPAAKYIPLDDLLSDEAAETRANQIQYDRSRAPRSSRRTSHPESPHTANVVAIDSSGNLVSLTATQGWMYGSHLVVDGLGLVLNHGMSRFDYSPGHPNSPAAGKRMQHNMAPMIALRDNEPAYAFGMPGGPKIVSVTSQLVLDAIAFGATPAKAIAAPRIHTEGDEPLLVSQHMPDAVVADLEKIGHTIRRENDMGGPVNVLTVDSQTRNIDIASGETIGAVAGF